MPYRYCFMNLSFHRRLFRVVFLSAFCWSIPLHSFGEWESVGSFSWISYSITGESGPSVAWLPEGPAVAWAALPYGLGPATSIELGWFDDMGQGQEVRVTDIPPTSPAFVELFSAGDGLVILFVRAGKQETDLVMASADTPQGPWAFAEIASGVRLDGLSGSVDDQGRVHACWFDEPTRTLSYRLTDRDGQGTTVVVAEEMGRNPSLILTEGASPWIAFSGADGTTLWCARAPSVEGAWDVQQVGPGGQFPAAARGPGGFPVVAHYDPLTEQVLLQSFELGLPGVAELVWAGPVIDLALAFDPLGRPRVVMSRTELIYDDPYCSLVVHYTLDIAYRTEETGWGLVTVHNNMAGCIAAGCTPSDLTRPVLVFSPEGVPVVGYKQNCTSHPMASHSVQLRAPVMPWSKDAQPPRILTFAPDLEFGGGRIAWESVPGACYRVWGQLPGADGWERVGDEICAAEDQRELSLDLPLGADAGRYRVTRVLPVEVASDQE